MELSLSQSERQTKGWTGTQTDRQRRHPPHARVELAALFLVAKKKLYGQAKKGSILCKKTWGIQP